MAVQLSTESNISIIYSLLTPLNLHRRKTLDLLDITLNCALSTKSNYFNLLQILVGIHRKYKRQLNDISFQQNKYRNRIDRSMI